jgi:hypothetical protein
MVRWRDIHARRLRPHSATLQPYRAATSVRAHRSVAELPDSYAPFTGQHSRGEPFGKALSHKVEIGGNLVKNSLNVWQRSCLQTRENLDYNGDDGRPSECRKSSYNQNGAQHMHPAAPSAAGAYRSCGSSWTSLKCPYFWMAHRSAAAARRGR